MKDKKWKVLFKKLPSQTIIDTMAPVVAETKDDAIQLALFGISHSNRDNQEAESIEIVSCTEIS